MQKKIPTILLAEDDETLGFLLQEYLSQKDMEVDWARNGAEALKLFNQNSYDLSLLDIMMPTIDGLTVAELFRNRQPGHPIIFLTAKSMHKDVERGYRAGADDYIKKPVNEDELVARIQAVLKRTATSSAIGTSQPFVIFQIGAYVFNSEELTLHLGDSLQKLTEMEAQLLKILCEKKGQLVHREYVLQKIWGRNNFLARKSMDVFISRLRKYLAGDESVQIVNVHGSGFVLEAD